jgi:hypothetical protein
MTIGELIVRCRDTGIVLQVAGEALDVEAPAEALTPELRDILKARKPDLMAVLWRIDAMRQHGVDLSPGRCRPELPPVAVARWFRAARAGVSVVARPSNVRTATDAARRVMLPLMCSMRHATRTLNRRVRRRHETTFVERHCRSGRAVGAGI